MDRRSWLWRRKSSEKGAADTENSASSPSDRLTDEQDTPKSTPSPEIPSKEAQDNENVKVKVLSERLSSAVLDIRAKDDLVKQHSKVAEEAVLGWEKAEEEIASLKAQNSALEERIVHLDGALKECVRQLRHTKEEQQQKPDDAAARQARRWESEKADLELRIVELRAKLEAKSELSVAGEGGDGAGAGARMASLEKENSGLKVQLLARTEELELRTIEKELNRRSAETARKQQLESIKKMARLEAECRRLQANATRSSIGVELRGAPSSVCAESVTDCQSDCSDSLASALITELDQFKNEPPRSAARRSASLAAADIAMMDDFLEMERLASAPPRTDDDNAGGGDQPPELEEKVRRLAAEKAGTEKALHEAQRELRASHHRAAAAEERSAELQRRLNLVHGERHAAEADAEAAEARRGEMEAKLGLAMAELASSLEKARALEERLESEKALTLELAARYQRADALESEAQQQLRAQLEASRSDARRLRGEAASLERSLEEEKAARCHGLEALGAKTKRAELELESARERIASLQDTVSTLERKVDEEQALSAELAGRRRHELEALETQRNELNSQLQSADSEIFALNEKCKTLEESAAKQAPLISELESQLRSARDEIKNLEENVGVLEKKLESQKSLSSAYMAALDASEAQKNRLASRFELKKREAEELHRKIGSLEEQILEERTQQSELAAQCQNLKAEISGRASDHQQQVKPMASRDFRIKKEKELARAAGKLTDCQKTIASLSSQLKSLADFDGTIPGLEEDESVIESWDSESKLFEFDAASYPERFGCLAVK